MWRPEVNFRYHSSVAVHLGGVIVLIWAFCCCCCCWHRASQIGQDGQPTSSALRLAPSVTRSYLSAWVLGIELDPSCLLCYFTNCAEAPSPVSSVLKAGTEDQFTLLPGACMKMTFKLIKDLAVYQLKLQKSEEKIGMFLHGGSHL